MLIQLRFDCNSTALRPFDDLRYDRAAGLRPKYIIITVGQRDCGRLAGYVTVTVTSMTSDMRSKDFAEVGSQWKLPQ